MGYMTAPDMSTLVILMPFITLFSIIFISVFNINKSIKILLIALAIITMIGYYYFFTKSFYPTLICCLYHVGIWIAGVKGIPT